MARRAPTWTVPVIVLFLLPFAEMIRGGARTAPLPSSLAWSQVAVSAPPLTDGGMSWESHLMMVGGAGSPIEAFSALDWHFDDPCEGRLINGGFEENYGWLLPATPATAAYTEQLWHSGRRSVRVGIAEGQDVYSYSSASQYVIIPADVSEATLHFWWYPVSAEGPLAAAAETQPDLSIMQKMLDGTFPSGTAAGDRQYVLVLDTNGNILKSLLWTRSNAQAWQEASYDLMPYRGRKIRILFGVYNNGNGLSTAMFADDASVTVCWPVPPQPTPTPTLIPVKSRGYLPLSLAGLPANRRLDLTVSLRPVTLPAW